MESFYCLVEAAESIVTLLEIGVLVLEGVVSFIILALDFEFTLVVPHLHIGMFALVRIFEIGVSAGVLLLELFEALTE